MLAATLRLHERVKSKARDLGHTGFSLQKEEPQWGLEGREERAPTGRTPVSATVLALTPVIQLLSFG